MWLTGVQHLPYLSSMPKKKRAIRDANREYLGAWIPKELANRLRQEAAEESKRQGFKVSMSDMLNRCLSRGVAKDLSQVSNTQ